MCWNLQNFCKRLVVGPVAKLAGADYGSMLRSIRRAQGQELNSPEATRPEHVMEEAI
jgi:hypothetical protein